MSEVEDEGGNGPWLGPYFELLKRLRGGQRMTDGTWFGKWSHVGIPHKDWACIDIEDMGDNLVVCEMCEHAEVRYIHVMKHDEWDGELRVGCVCAERMGEEKARENEERVKRLQRNPDKAYCQSVVDDVAAILRSTFPLQLKDREFLLDIMGEMIYSARPRTKVRMLSIRQMGWLRSILGTYRGWREQQERRLA